MGWKFRRRVTLFPGVRINLSRRGLSTTFGIPGASINIGPQGAFLNAGIPGTGIYDRRRIGGSPTDSPRAQFSPDTGPATVFLPPGYEEIKSKGSNEIISPGLKGVRETLWAAREEREALKVEVKAGEKAVRKAARRLKLIRIIPFHKSILTRKLAETEQNHRECAESLTSATNQLTECRVALEVDVDATLVPLYTKIRTAFDSLCGSSKKWDITARADVDQRRERSNAAYSLTRIPVNLKKGILDFIAFKQEALHFVNANGADLYLYPAFLLAFRSFEDFALIDVPDLSIEFRDAPFVEEQGVPPDSEVISQTWRYVNKNGSPDRRFSNNYQIPVALYGQLNLRSQGGLNESYMFSNAAAARDFSNAFNEFKNMITGAGSKRTN